MITVTSIKRSDYAPWLLERHYARRMCPVSHAFGAYAEGELMGVVTYGPPASPQVARSVVMPKFASIVLELNRLCVRDGAPKNTSSALVGRSLQMLPKPSIVVSYADGAQGHIGYIYQATNFKYFGAAAAHDAEYESPTGKVMHPRSLAAEGITNPTQWARANGWKKRTALPKHRYVFVSCAKKQRKAIEGAILWESEPYPKGETRRYDASAPVQTQGVLAL